MAESIAQTAKRRHRQTLIGVVTAARRTPKTIRVEVCYRVRHRKYGKMISRVTKLHAHDEEGAANEGDMVQVMQCRPISKSKCWRLIKVLEKSVAQ